MGEILGSGACTLMGGSLLLERELCQVAEPLAAVKGRGGTGAIGTLWDKVQQRF